MKIFSLFLLGLALACGGGGNSDYSLSKSEEAIASDYEYDIAPVSELKVAEDGSTEIVEPQEQKIIKTGPKNVTTGMCPECKTIGRIFIIGSVGNERAKCPACNQIFDL